MARFKEKSFDTTSQRAHWLIMMHLCKCLVQGCIYNSHPDYSTNSYLAILTDISLAFVCPHLNMAQFKLENIGAGGPGKNSGEQLSVGFHLWTKITFAFIHKQHSYCVTLESLASSTRPRPGCQARKHIWRIGMMGPQAGEAGLHIYINNSWWTDTNTVAGHCSLAWNIQRLHISYLHTLD